MLGELILGSVEKLVISAISKGTAYAAADFFQKRRVERAVEVAAANVAETLVAFFKAEGISEDNQRVIIQECVEELAPIVDDPSSLFEGSLNGQVIFEQRFMSREMPQSIRELGLQGAFEMAFVRVATVVGTVPAGVKDWEANAWSENYRRLDLIAAEIKSVFDRVDAIKGITGAATDVAAVRKYLAQRLAVSLDVTGLRAEKVVHRSMEDMFVHPAIINSAKPPANERPEAVESDVAYVSRFARPGFLGVIMGAPGSGKSTWSRWLQRRALSDLWDGVALRVELRAVDLAADPSIVALLKSAVGSNYADRLDSGFVDRLIQEGKILLIFDGFDEIALENRDDAVEWIRGSVAYAQNCPTIVTSRPLTTAHIDQIGASWSKWSIEPFDVNRVVQYITRWYSDAELTLGLSVPDAQELAKEWREDSTIGPLTGNPLLLSTLLMVHHLDGNLPTGRSELYDRYVKGMLGVWDERRRVRREALTIPLDSKRAVLSDIALRMIISGRDQLEERDILEVVGLSLQRLGERFDPRSVVDHLRERSGLIVGPGVYNFSHKTIGEFLVAQMIVQGDRIVDDGRRLDTFKLFELRNDDRWNAVLFLWSGLAPISSVEAFIRQCADAGDVDISFGILLDQYDRFVPNAKEQLFSYLKGSLNTIEYNDRSSWAVGTSVRRGAYAPRTSLDRYTKGEVTILDSQVRGISSREQRGVRNLIDRLMADDLLSPDGLDGFVGDARKVVWMSGVIRARSGGVLKRLVSKVPHKSGKQRYLYWMLERQISQYLIPRDISSSIAIVNEAIREITETDREFGQLIGVAVMSTSCRRFSSAPHASEWMPQMAVKSARLVVHHASSWTNDALLLSAGWMPHGFGEDRVSGETDILKQYRGRLVAAGAGGYGGQEIESAVKLCDELMTRRASLLPLQGIERAI